MYSSSNSATHHIFFPPRLQSVSWDQDPNRPSTHTRNQFSFDGFVSHQPDRPACLPFRRSTANHGDNTLLFRRPQQFRMAVSLSFMQRPLQSVLAISPRDRPYGRRGESNQLRNLGRTQSGVQLQQAQRSQDHSHLLNASAQQTLQFLSLLRFQVERLGWARHAQVYAKTFSIE